jgi:8-oxo-dGTP pyrophosphatase MutT (NUDIX family)
MTGKDYAYGGVLIDSDGRILLREPTKHFDNYVWTFAKGRQEGAESGEEAALREVREETGVVAKIVAPILGEFEGGTTINIYFLMSPTEAASKPNRRETASVYWVARLDRTKDVNVDKAREMIGQTKNAVGRDRDLKVLDAAVALWREHRQLQQSD